MEASSVIVIIAVGDDDDDDMVVVVVVVVVVWNDSGMRCMRARVDGHKSSRAEGFRRNELHTRKQCAPSPEVRFLRHLLGHARLQLRSHHLGVVLWVMWVVWAVLWVVVVWMVVGGVVIFIRKA